MANDRDAPPIGKTYPMQADNWSDEAHRLSHHSAPPDNQPDLNLCQK